MATQGNFAQSATALGSHERSPIRRVFHADVAASVSPLPVLTPRVRNSAAWGTIRLVVKDDDSFEYLATIYNPKAETFTSAVVRRGGGGSESEAVATLFSDLTLRTQYSQLRGTVSVARDVRAGILAEELRENPEGFVVTVHSTASGASGAIRGIIR